MPKGKFFYLFIGGIIIFLLGLLLGVILLQQPVKRPQIPEPPAAPQSPAVAQEEAPPAAVPLAPPGDIEPPVSMLMPAPAAKEETPAAPAPAIKAEFQKGMNFVAWTSAGYSNSSSISAMEQMANLGINWAGLVSTWYQDKYNSTSIYSVKDKSPTDESLVFAIRKLHELKFKVMLKPHVDIIDAAGKWRGDIGFDKAEDWQAWFDSYTAFVLHYAAIAARENVELFCIGTELSRASVNQGKRWRELIKKIKEVYKGPLTYAANWSAEYDEIAFWDALDYAGIDAYFPLVCSAQPKVEELKSAWSDWLRDIEAWQKRINKPVLITEIGYKSLRDATDEPWQHVGVGELDLGLQVNCYQALLESFWDKPWFYGVYWWYWGVNPRMGGELNRGFTPQNKPAQDVVKEWYNNKPVPEKIY
ncbi:MAG: hypothetical protein WC321_03685 [Candidatus Omnitrophota bacterium]|jgi:hypothetical protein